MRTLLSIEKKGQLQLVECHTDEKYEFNLSDNVTWVREILTTFGELGVGQRLKVEGFVEKKKLVRYGECLLGEVKYTLGVCRTCVLSLDPFEETLHGSFKFIVLDDFSEVELEYEGLREVYLFDKKKTCSLQEILTEQIILNLDPYPKKKLV